DDGIFADTYFKSALFHYVEDKYGRGIFSRKALKIYGTIDPGLQRAAEDAVRKGLALYDERRGEYTVSYHLDKGRWDTFVKSEERDITLSPLAPGKVYNLLISERLAEGYSVFTGKEKGVLRISLFPFKPGDVVKGVYDGTDRKRKIALFSPIKTSTIEGALICMDVSTGYLYAVVG